MEWIPIDKKRIKKTHGNMIMISGQLFKDPFTYFHSVVNYHPSVDKFESYDTDKYIDETEINYTLMAEFDGSIVIPQPKDIIK